MKDILILEMVLWDWEITIWLSNPANLRQFDCNSSWIAGFVGFGWTFAGNYSLYLSIYRTIEYIIIDIILSRDVIEQYHFISTAKLHQTLFQSHQITGENLWHFTLTFKMKKMCCGIFLCHYLILKLHTSSLW